MTKNDQSRTGKNDKHSDRTNQPIAPTHIVIDPPIPTLPSQPVAGTKQPDSQEKPLPRFLTPEWIIVYITAGYVVIAWLTLRAIKAQVDRMDIQANDARESSDANVLIARSTLAAIEKQANAMEQQLQVIATDQRPWLSLDVSLSGPLTHREDGCWETLITCNLRNVGKRPAIDVSIEAKLLPVIGSRVSKSGEITGGTDVNHEVHAMCDRSEHMSNYYRGFLVFPDSPWPHRLILVGDQLAFESTEGYDGQFLIVVGVAYRSPFSKQHHRTAKAYALMNPVNNGWIELSGETIEIGSLYCAAWPLDGSYAD